MQINKIDQYTKGWFVGNFSPVVLPSKEFEIAVKWFKAGEKEPLHKQNDESESNTIEWLEQQKE